MATIMIGHHPELTAEDVKAIFERQFGDKYEIVRTPRLLLCDFLVKRSAWTSVAVRLRQGKNKTRLVFSGFAPSLWARIALFLTAGLSILICYLVVWKGITDEVRSFIEEAEEFR